ncbi:MAG: lipase [Gemmatimonadota bacterium]|nr:MAG: lipase [Gemmatimonadota bacterium]
MPLRSTPQRNGRPCRGVRLALAVGCSLLASSAAATDALSPTHADVEFARVDDRSLPLDLYLPAGDTPAPLVIWIHGGGWRAGSKEECPVRWLVEHGYAVASISYRFTDEAIFPAQIHDCKAAVRWLRAHADEYGLDAARIAAAGASAGGHLAALLATTEGMVELEGTIGEHLDRSSRVRAAADYFGATDLVLRSRTQPRRANRWGSVVHRLLGGGANRKTELAKLASPAYHVTPDDAPLLVFHGDRDQTVLLDQSERIRDAYVAAEVPVQLRVLKGGGHGGAAFYTGENRGILLEFLAQHLGGPARP